MISARRQIVADAYVLAAIAFVFLPRLTYAYLDPGTGSLIWQVLLAGALTALYLSRRYWHHIKRLLGITRPKGSEEEDTGDGNN
jgi:hypothetical protein